MSRAAVTFDFHNTIARCDAWFELEVKGLVSAFLSWESDCRGIVVDPPTLWSADEAYRQLRQAVQEHGNELTAEECIAAVLDELSLAYDECEIARGVRDLMRPNVDLARPMPGAIETIHELAGSGVPLGVISSAVYHPFVEWSLKAFGILEAFETVTTSASSGFYKSRPEIYYAALTALKAAPDLSIHVGDSGRYDVVGAQRAGMRTVWILEGHPNDGSAPNPDLILPNLVGSAPQIKELLNRPTNELGTLSAGSQL